jgi:uncharacterized protein YndB with AHSA1/START domain
MPVSPAVDCTVEIGAGPARVLSAFFDPAALRSWWLVTRSVTTPRVLGVYALEWEATSFHDPMLGPLGGVLHGTVVDLRPPLSFFVADVYWIPPAGDPIGPMALHVTCSLVGASTRLRLQVSGFEESPRWRRYYEVFREGIVPSLERLKAHLEGADSASCASDV